jgi:hypothetical protein
MSQKTEIGVHSPLASRCKLHEPVQLNHLNLDNPGSIDTVTSFSTLNSSSPHFALLRPQPLLFEPPSGSVANEDPSVNRV